MNSKKETQIIKIDYLEDLLDVDTKNTVIGIIVNFSTETFICKSKTSSKYYDRFRVCPDSNMIKFLTKDNKMIDNYPIYDMIYVEPDIDYDSYKDLDRYITSDEGYNPISCFNNPSFNNSIDDFESDKLNNYSGNTESFSVDYKLMYGEIELTLTSSHD